ncbi:MAG: SH3 domain-containing protein [Pseudomonadota bacterium]
MPKLITASCFVLFWVFYEMSGGADFQPRERVVISQSPFAQPATRKVTYERPQNAPQVTNASYIPVSTEPLTAINAAVVNTSATPVITPEVAVAAPAPVQEPVVVAPAPKLVPELVYVSGNRVNLRRGPGTDHRVIVTLPQGTAAEIITTNDIGWTQIRLKDSDQTGWMATRLLSKG